MFVARMAVHFLSSTPPPLLLSRFPLVHKTTKMPTATDAPSLLVIAAIFLQTAHLCIGETLDIQITEELPIGTVIADLASQVSKNGKSQRGQMVGSFRLVVPNEADKRLVEVIS